MNQKKTKKTTKIKYINKSIKNIEIKENNLWISKQRNWFIMSDSKWSFYEYLCSNSSLHNGQREVIMGQCPWDSSLAFDKVGFVFRTVFARIFDK